MTMTKKEKSTFDKMFNPSPEEKRKIRNEKRKRERRQTRLISLEREPHQLIRPFEGLVKKVEANYNCTSVSGNDGIIGPGGRSWSTGTGYVGNLDIQIESDSPVKRLTFLGYSPIRKGDEIKVYSVAAEIAELPIPIRLMNGRRGEFRSKNSVLIEGPLKEEMIALRIDILGEGRTDYAVNYDPKTKSVSKPYLV